MTHRDLARKLINIDEKQTQANADSTIFGSIGTLASSIGSRPPYRIGMWPCSSSETHHQQAMGVWVTLSFLLERWQDIQVYRLFAQVDEDPSGFEWSLENTAFTPDDWALDDLDENIAIWGELTHDEQGVTLTVFLENDLDEDTDDTDSLVLEEENLAALLNALPKFAQDLADKIGAERLDETQPVYAEIVEINSTDFAELGKSVTAWQGYLLAHLAGFDWEDDDIEAVFDDVLLAAKDLGTPFAPWLIGQSIRQIMRPGWTLIGDLIVEQADTVIKTFPDSVYPALYMGEGLFALGYAQQSYDRLRTSADMQPNNVAVWIKLAELYVRGGRLLEAIDAIQTSIENDATSPLLYRLYGNVLQLAERYGEAVTAYILIDIQEVNEDDYILFETIAAYDKVLETEPDDLRALHAQISQLIYLAYEEDERLWDRFERLLALDTTGERVRDVIDSFYDVPDVSPARDALEQKMAREGERIDLYINLASLHLVQDEGDEALPYLEKAKALASNDQQLAEVERLMLMANDPEFEQRFSEIVAILDAGNSANAGNVDYLEATVENAPHLLEAHLALGRAYYAWGDADAALEVLLDAQRTLPQAPSVLDWLGRILWEANEQALAFEYLNKGLALFPNYVPLLVRVGNYLFQNRQLKQARVFLAHAEQIAPRDPSLQQVRAYIATELAKNPELYAENES